MAKTRQLQPIAMAWLKHCVKELTLLNRIIDFSITGQAKNI